jgi:hypothetical protein
MTRRECDDLLAMDVEERIGADEKRAGARLRIIAKAPSISLSLLAF